MNLEAARDMIDVFHGPPMAILSDCLRGFMVSRPGRDLIAADFSNIEGRVLAWLAGEEWKLEAFRNYDTGTGPDLYKISAQRIYETDLSSITKEQRLIGKVAELALGYQGGRGSFLMMAKTYLVKVPEAQVDDIKAKWRAANPAICRYWYAVENAAMHAVLNPNLKIEVGQQDRSVAFKSTGYFLFCRLPSGRVLTYPYPRIQEVKTPWGQMKDAITYMGEDSEKKIWCRQKTYGGSLVNNITQGVARCLLSDALKRVHGTCYKTVFHAHDEIVSEVPENIGSVEELKSIMTASNDWARGIPVAAEGWRGKRYRK